jgi:hypothetical protein
MSFAYEPAGGDFRASLIASDTSIESPPEPAKLVEGSCEGGCDVAADLLSNPSAWISRAPAAAFRRDRLRFRAVWA